MTLQSPGRGLLIAVAAVVLSGSARAQTAFDHSHAAWSGLLKRHVVVLRDGHAAQVRYAGFAADRSALKAYLQTLSSVSEAQFSTFGKPQQQAFLINAYNAFTVELILTKYPGIRSIKELGTLFQSPWQIRWVPLLGRTVSLDDIEHAMLRQRGRYDDPRAHFAVNCASVGCPALREEAFVPDRLDAQLEQQARRFLSDRSRNRFNAERDRLEVSRIFDWYGEDFRLGHRGIASLRGFLARFADQLADSADHRERIRSQRIDVAFLDYDWMLNDAPARGAGE
jgi:hypothetical protein